jgi:glycosyltransferase involved in cell wall biosynthesis
MHGGAEVHAQNLVCAVREAGHEVELVAIPFKWYPAEILLDQIAQARMVALEESNGRPIDRLIGLKFPSYFIPHPNKVLWILHQHRPAYDLWDHPQFGDLILQNSGRVVRDAIRKADRLYLQEARRIYANSRNVADRLKSFSGIDSTPLYHPPGGAEHYYSAEAEPYFFFPSRITPLKRQALVIEALAQCRQETRVVFAGLPESLKVENELKLLSAKLGVADRVEWLGPISEQGKRDRYAHSLGVVYPPLDEDYGYVTLEAMLAAKPVITTMDAGGPLEFVEHEATGLVVEPRAEALAIAMDELWANLAGSRRWGERGRERYESMDISWNNVVDTLLA